METPNRYFKTYPLLLTFEQLVVECNLTGKVILTKTDSGFIIDVYQPNKQVTTVTVNKEPECLVEV